MISERLRDLERRYRTTGAVEDEAAWLRARERAGDLATDRIRLAAWCERPAALAVSGDLTGDGPPEPQPFESREQVALQWWVLGLGAFGPPAPVRAATAVFRERLAAEARWLRRRFEPAADAVVGRVEAALTRLAEAVDGWTACPCADHVAAVAAILPDLGIVGRDRAGLRDEAEATALDHFATSGAALFRVFDAAPLPYTLEHCHAEVRRSIEQLGYNPSREALGAAEMDPPPGATRQSRLAASYVGGWLRFACSDITSLSADTRAHEGEMAARLHAEMRERLGRWALEERAGDSAAATRADD